MMEWERKCVAALSAVFVKIPAQRRFSDITKAADIVEEYQNESLSIIYALIDGDKEAAMASRKTLLKMQGAE